MGGNVRKSIQWPYSLDKDVNPPQYYLLSHLQLCKQHSAAHKGSDLKVQRWRPLP